MVGIKELSGLIGQVAVKLGFFKEEDIKRVLTVQAKSMLPDSATEEEIDELVATLGQTAGISPNKDVLPFLIIANRLGCGLTKAQNDIALSAQAAARIVLAATRDDLPPVDKIVENTFLAKKKYWWHK